MDEKILVTQSSMPSYEEYIEAIKPLWDSHWLTNMGAYHRQLEQELKEYLDVPYISLMVNGHMALELAIQAFDFPEGAEIITTPFTFISTTHAIVRNRLKPVFCDVKLFDGTIDESKIEGLITENTVAILPVHVYGNVCNVEVIQKIADKYNLKVIYDAAHAFGVKYNDKGIGNYGDASIFSFHATKVFNTIEGGAISFSESSLYHKFYNLKNFGIKGEELVVDVGANAKMNEFCAIMGLCNLKHMGRVLESRKKRYEYYVPKLLRIPGVKIINYPTNFNGNYAYLPVLFTDECILTRDEVYELLRKNNIYARKYFYPITADQDCYKNNFINDELTVARKLAKQVLVIPFYENIEFNTIDHIIDILESNLNRRLHL